jgi:hypothetical protein
VVVAASVTGGIALRDCIPCQSTETQRHAWYVCLVIVVRQVQGSVRRENALHTWKEETQVELRSVAVCWRWKHPMQLNCALAGGRSNVLYCVSPSVAAAGAWLP